MKIRKSKLALYPKNPMYHKISRTGFLMGKAFGVYSVGPMNYNAALMGYKVRLIHEKQNRL